MVQYMTSKDEDRQQELHSLPRLLFLAAMRSIEKLQQVFRPAYGRNVKPMSR